MAQLDKLIEKLQPGQEIILEAGKPPALISAGSSSPLLAQQLTAAQVYGLTGEIAPADVREQIAQSKSVKFEYVCASKTLVVTFTIDNGLALTRLTQSARRSDAPLPAAVAGEPEINGLLRKMAALGASDLHLTSAHRPMVRVN
ncbi:MAG TPA: hypothetical protein DCW72_06240, partial [Elusimicrobia bacterium]|nr:hypothetical protein [Elusimicrobiota bacterium]